MPWQPALNALRDALATLFATEADARRVVASARMDDRSIPFHPAAIKTWQAILDEATKRDKVEALVAAAREEYPRDAALRAAIAGHPAGAAPPAPQRAPANPVTWLHLSDLHFSAQEQATWQRNVVLRPLLDDVAGLLEREELSLDLILVSGDIANRSDPQEYALAAAFFDELLARTGVGKDRLLLVPGNHDVERGAISRGARSIAASLDTREALDEVLSSEGDRDLLLRRLERYGAFVRQYLGEGRGGDALHTYAYPVDLECGRVCVLGLDSAFLAYGGQEDDRVLALGEKRVRELLEAAQGADLRLALMHHPTEWLRPYDREPCEALLARECAFILHGHLHQSGLLMQQTPDARSMVIAAGACYESRDYPNSYNVARFDPASGEGRVYLRRYSDRQAGFWARDATTYRNVDGQYDFYMPLKPSAKPRKPKKNPPPERETPSHADATKLEAAYLRRLQITCNALPLSIIDPRAMERTRQQSMDLLPIYVALDTETRAPLAEEAKTKGARRPRQEALAPERETRPLPALEAAARDRLMVLLGDPGSGKSTFLSHLALCLAGAGLERLGERGELAGDQWLEHLAPAWTPGPLLPLRVTLRHYAAGPHCDGTAEGLWAFIGETLQAQGMADYARHLRQRLLDGGVLVLLDGLDEVPDPAQRRTVRDAVADLAATYNDPRNRYLVTCCGYAYRDPCCQLDRFAAHTLAPLTEEQRDAFVGCWYEEIRRLGWKSEAEAQDLAGRLRGAIRRRELQALAGNPCNWP